MYSRKTLSVAAPRPSTGALLPLVGPSGWVGVEGSGHVIIKFTRRLPPTNNQNFL